MSIIDQNNSNAREDNNTATVNANGAPEVHAAPNNQPETKAYPRPSEPDLMRGMVFRDTRPDEIARVHANILKLRKREGVKIRTLPPSVFVRILNVKSGLIKIISVEDPYAEDETLPRSVAVEFITTKDWVLAAREPVKQVRHGHTLTEAQRAGRDRNMLLIGDIVKMGDEVFDREARAKVIKGICLRENIETANIDRILRRYFQGGMIPNAVAPRWTAGVEGADGRRRRILCTAEVRAGVARPKFGRPRADKTVGFLVAQADQEKIIKGAAKFYHTRLGGNWHRAWLLTIAASYLEIDPHSRVPMDVQLKKFPPNTYPSITQFKYWAQSDHEVVKRMKKRHGEKDFNMNSRPLNGRTEDSSAGPGAIFMIDGTRLDVVLVHCVTRRPIGRPQLYFVVDAFSHLIVGYCLSLENAGLSASVGAILACARNKEELCREFGVELDPGEWPAQCLPDMLIGDSEIATLHNHALVQSKLIDFQVKPAYRPDLKGLVESLIKSINTTTIHHLPGRSSGERFRCEPNPDHLAVIDTRAINKIIINFIRRHNFTVNKDYQMTEAMAKDALVPTAVNVWNWGLVNCGGMRKTWEMDLLKRTCLPVVEAHIGRRGLVFEGVYYKPAPGELPEFEQWRVKCTGNQTRKVKITRNPMCVEEVWLHYEDRLIPMELADESRLYKQWTIDDLFAYFAEKSANESPANDAANVKMAILEQMNHEEVKLATKITEAVRGNYAKRRREKTNKVADRADEKGRQNGSEYTNKTTPDSNATPTALAQQDDSKMAARLRNAA